MYAIIMYISFNSSPCDGSVQILHHGVIGISIENAPIVLEKEYNSYTYEKYYIENCFGSMLYERYELEDTSRIIRIRGNLIGIDKIYTDTVDVIDPLTGLKVRRDYVQRYMPLKNGSWYYFSSTGKLEKLEVWDLGSLISREVF